MRRINYILRKLVFAVLSLLGLSILIYYTTTFFSPQARVQLFISSQRIQSMRAPDPTPALIEKYGLNDPFPIQYMNWLKLVLKGSLGYSHKVNMPVNEAIFHFFPATLELVIYSAPLIFIGGYKLGVYSAKRVSSKAPQEDPIDFAIRGITTIGYSIPSFCLGILLLVIFYVGMGLGGIGNLGNAAKVYTFSSQWTHFTGLITIDALLNGQLWIFFDALKHLVLPVITLATQMIAIVARITRSSMINELVKPNIVTAKAMGLEEGKVINHAKKGAITSTLTVSGILFASMLTGVVVTEYLFLRKGLGSLVVTAADRLDYPLLVGLALVFCVIFMLVNLIVDIIYAYLDPRVEL